MRVVISLLDLSEEISVEKALSAKTIS